MRNILVLGKSGYVSVAFQKYMKRYKDSENRGGIYYPQNRHVICTTELICDIARECGHRIIKTKIFNPILRMASGYIRPIRKAFGNLMIDTSISGHFDWKYNVVGYRETIMRVVAGIKKN